MITTEIKTAYTIEVTYPERQHLPAQFLEPVSLPCHPNILDIGCGLSSKISSRQLLNTADKTNHITSA